ncbi:MAG: hypothetical protein FWF02_00920 [Micrococcales bacterium]|nr:hypothetical protein [Micrococcales bacterium]MCL2666258.1 hypothetical protein [Micrococcales bacterium]
MTKNPQLDDALAVFAELGWAGASYADAPTLPVGTDAQRKTALAGLRSGDWVGNDPGGRWAGNDPARRWGSYLGGVDQAMLWLFAVRVGVDARRAAATHFFAPWVASSTSDDAALAVMVQRGPAFAREMIQRECQPGLRWGEATQFAPLAIRLTAHHQLPVDNREYITDWAAYAEAVLTRDFSQLTWQPRGGPAPDAAQWEPLIAERFVEHVRAGVALGVHANGPFGRVLPAGVERGWLAHDEAVELVLAGLDCAARPSDRKAWVEAWLDRLGVTDDEVVSRAHTLVPVLATGDAVVVERLAPLLIAGVPDDLLADVVTAALAAPTKKALRVVLTAMAARPRPAAPTVEAVAPQLNALDVARDKPLARALQAVVDAWGVVHEAPEPATQVEGLWRPVPEVWTVPRFDHGEQTPDALTQMAADRAAGAGVLVHERFLAVANAVGRRDTDLVRTALVGLRAAAPGSTAAAWLAGELGRYLDGPRPGWADPIADPVRARELAVFQRLGQVPCLLSEPSTVDLRVHPADLLARLQAYDDTGASVSEADLLLALARLDVDAVDDRTRAGFDRLTVPVLLQSGKPMNLTAGPAVSAYLDDPAIAPKASSWTYEVLSRWVPPASLREFPARFGKYMDVATTFPTWPATFNPFGYEPVGVTTVAHRSAPVTPDVVAGVLMSWDFADPQTIRAAWERGLLRPGPPGECYLDWDTPPDNLAAVASAVGGAARDGLLAVAWQVLDDLAGLAVSGARVTTGAVQVAETIAALLPEVLHAVAVGTANPAVLTLPGTRALAARPGSSRAVTTARETVAALSVPTRPAPAPPHA